MRTFPSEGRPAHDVLAEISADRTADIDWRSGKAFSLVYNTDDPELEELLETVGREFLHENALNPFRYRTLLRMETEVVEMASSLFGAPARSGSMSSGGTESIFLAVHVARELARDRGIDQPTLVCTDTAHPAFAKACHYLSVQQIRLPHGPDGRADPDRYRDAIDARTALVVVSAPSYPFGVIDPIAEVAAISAEQGVPCHVDACLGGWLLPWWERLGPSVTGTDTPPFDFRVEGVTSLSADIHKYGYCFKGASVVLYREPAMLQKQIFMFDDWPGGLYASSTAAGTRSGAPIAGAWAAISHLGEDGYLRLARRVADANRRFQSGINSIDGLAVHYHPDMSVFEFGSDPDSSVPVDADGVCDVMDRKGWNLDRQQGGLHLMVAPGHDRVVDAFVADLADAVAHHGSGDGGVHVYGGVAP